MEEDASSAAPGMAAGQEYASGFGKVGDRVSTASHCAAVVMQIAVRAKEPKNQQSKGKDTRNSRRVACAEKGAVWLRRRRQAVRTRHT